MGRRTALAGAVFCVALASAAPPRWRADDQPSERDTAQHFTERGAAGTFREMHASQTGPSSSRLPDPALVLRRTLDAGAS